MSQRSFSQVMLTLLLGVGAACAENVPTPSASTGGVGGLQRDQKKLPGDGQVVADSASQSVDVKSGSASAEAGSSKTLQVAPNDGPAPTAVVFPILDFNGKGTCTCQGKVHTTLAKIATKLDDSALRIDMYSANMILNGKSKGQQQATEEIQRNTGVTLYTRPNKTEIKALKEASFDLASYAIFATSVTKERQGQTYTFDKPLPVFPWPAVASRYKALKEAPGQSKSWTANVSGFHNFAVTITMTLAEASADQIVVLIHTDIAGDDQGKYYEDFPVARDSKYIINPQALIVSQIEATNLFFGDQCGGVRETVRMAYQLCKRDAQGKVDQFPCEQ